MYQGEDEENHVTRRRNNKKDDACSEDGNCFWPLIRRAIRRPTVALLF